MGGFEVLQAFIGPEVIITQGQDWEEPFFWNGVEAHKTASDIPHIALPAPSINLMWMAHIDSTALQGKSLYFAMFEDNFEILTFYQSGTLSMSTS
jgi:hypothetical protein